ncbi:MAG: prolipoprotein diacylglyceryl transferase [Phycisphaerae bacterium]
MHPWLVNGWPVTTYGVCIVFGLILAWLLARRLAGRAAVDASLVDLMVPLVVGAGIAGAYAFGWWTDAVTAEASHGVVLVGAMVCATAAGVGYSVLARIPIGVIGDVLAAPAALGIACGRVGCFFAGCCYGKVAPWWLGVRFPRGSFAFVEQVRGGALEADALASLPVYPVQLMEAGLCAGLAGLLVSGFSRRQVVGERFLLLGVGYALIRFVLEFLRADNPPVVGVLTFSQVACGWLLAVSLLTLWVRRRWAEELHLRLPALEG